MYAVKGWSTGGSSSSSSSEQKTTDAFWKAVNNPSIAVARTADEERTMQKAGKQYQTREQFIKSLQAQYGGSIDSNDIATAVYQSYAD